MPDSTKPFDLSASKVLVVDDIQANRDILVRTLDTFGVEILQAESGEQALQITLAQQPDLILMDISMSGMTGLDACVALKKDEATRDIPVIFVTSKRETEDIVECFRVGGIDYISKPFRIDEVRVRVENHLNMRLLMKQREQLIRQIESRKRETEDRERRISAILDNIADGILVLDKNGIIQRINPVVEQILSADRERLLGTNICERFRSTMDRGQASFATFAQIAHTVSASNDAYIEKEGVDLQGRVFPAEINICEIPSEENTYVMVLRDITERKRVENELLSHRNHLAVLVAEKTRDLQEVRDKALEANRLKSEFLATMSHEL